MAIPKSVLRKRRPPVPLSFAEDPFAATPLVCPIFAKQNGQRHYVGAGTFLTELGHFVTARHVLEAAFEAPASFSPFAPPRGRQGAELFLAQFSQKGPNEIGALARDIVGYEHSFVADIAVGYIRQLKRQDRELIKAPRPVFSSELPAPGSPVATFAYPDTDTKSIGGHLIMDTVAEICPPRGTGEHRNCVWLRLNMYQPFGMSGCPVFNAQGRIVAVISSCFDLSDNGTESTAIPIREILNFPLSSDLTNPASERRTVAELVKSGHIAIE